MSERSRHLRTGLGHKASLGCVNACPAARRSQEAGFTQPRDHLIAHPCTYWHVSGFSRYVHYRSSRHGLDYGGLCVGHIVCSHVKFSCANNRSLVHFFLRFTLELQRRAKEWSLGCVSPVPWLLLATEHEFMQPRAHSFAQLWASNGCLLSTVWRPDINTNYTPGRVVPFPFALHIPIKMPAFFLSWFVSFSAG